MTTAVATTLKVVKGQTFEVTLHDNPTLFAKLDLPTLGSLEQDTAALVGALEQAVDLQRQSLRHTLRAAVLLTYARRHFGTTAEVAALAQRELGLSKTTAYRFLRVGDLLAREVVVQGRDGAVPHVALLSCDLDKLDALARLTPGQFQTFWTIHRNPHEMSRAEVRDAVAYVTGERKQLPGDPPADPSGQLHLPGLEELLAVDPATLDPLQEAERVGVFAQRLRRCVDRLDDDTFAEVVAGLEEELRELRDARLLRLAASPRRDDAAAASLATTN